MYRLSSSIFDQNKHKQIKNEKRKMRKIKNKINKRHLLSLFTNNQKQENKRFEMAKCYHSSFDQTNFDSLFTTINHK